MTVKYVNGDFSVELNYAGKLVVNFQGNQVEVGKLLGVVQNLVDMKDFEPNDGEADFKVGEGVLSIDLD